MDPLTLGLILGSTVLVGSSIKGSTSSSPSSPAMKEIENEVYARVKDASRITIPSRESWVKVQHGNETWLVAPYYIAPVGIGEAARIAKQNGLDLPSPQLVDAIWKAADLKLEPHPRGQYDKPPSDFTGKTMNSPETHIAQLAYIQKQIEDSGNPNFKLLAGTHKDVVMGKTPDGQLKLGIYGWHHLNGKVIQGFMWGHASGSTPETDWKDYSQGLRVVKKIMEVA